MGIKKTLHRKVVSNPYNKKSPEMKFILAIFTLNTMLSAVEIALYKFEHLLLIALNLAAKALIAV